MDRYLTSGNTVEPIPYGWEVVTINLCRVFREKIEDRRSTYFFIFYTQIYVGTGGVLLFSM